MSRLFDPLVVRDVTIPNRLMVSPMCQYGAQEGYATDFHLAHLGRFALGGFGLVCAEATAVLPEGRSTPKDLGIWSDAHIPMLQRITSVIKQSGSVPGIQLGHAGAKGGLTEPWVGSRPSDEAFNTPGQDRWDTISPSGLPVGAGWPAPRSMTDNDLALVAAAFPAAAQRADQAGFEFIEIHGGHGYLLSQFLSPLTNLRSDGYGGDRAGRMRLALEVVEAVRRVWPTSKPLCFRVSAVDTGGPEGVTIEDTIVFSRELKRRGVDLVDCSSGGVRTHPYRLPVGYGYQTQFAEQVRHSVDIGSIAVGLILDAVQANEVIETGKADLVAIGRAALNDPNWPHHAYAELFPEHEFKNWPDRYRWGLEHQARQLAKDEPLRRG
ncbi:2,4-dienoyl-CoA reductase-like NADH-dependent reductase (Old Yellow Enzyme family) [Paraburkholderia sp. BL18I3N2]|uniref:NADH:flavin oxidoreductase/NADH oxidase n=1 Tax=unclassified Paraburkholderia TaxID=2615204 RepID=UPI000D04CD16|nr:MULTISPECIES: NADH:flavin oxidoreductase/NADH oxidase [unclassified Paraburkholderia]PRX19194.1 2,4-dienoyl-CoA reductase-like NADH-dependent reductase (Old Yellow Enzyme family) [Paraburkholderia sp. BL18I3N2]PRX89424.1 2,4-dienoyl-CoA reductase-like NADH-dependent reductase (Old Yellow Enzyme family) [Paraburkholderia sp. BL25I1N1]